jgi:membrane associated rhomboid family serine protease
MIPIRCLVWRSRVAVVTGSLVLANVLAFLFELSLGRDLRFFVYAFGVRPYALLAGVARFDPIALVPVATSMFLHGGWLHLAGNMLFLWVFGSVLEDRLGHARFALLYAAAGAVAAFAQAFASPYSNVPQIGASGAIAGVLGAYLLLLPWSRVRSLVPIFIILLPLDVPAPFFLIVWFVTQLLSGVAAVDTGQTLGGVAYWAHVGGFVAGAALAAALGEARRQSVGGWRPPTYDSRFVG